MYKAVYRWLYRFESYIYHDKWQWPQDGGDIVALASATTVLPQGYIRWTKKNAPTLVIFKNTRYVIYITYLSMVGKINSLAFHPYPTFVILTTSMDTILKTVSVVILKWYHNFTLDDIAAFSLFADILHTNSCKMVNT